MSDAIKRLMDAGIIPQRCFSWECRCEAVPARFEITSKVYVSEEDMGKIADALIDAKARGEVVSKYILRTPGSPDEVEVMDECLPLRSASVPPQDAATACRLVDALRTSWIAKGVDLRPVDTMPTGSASGERT